jgi:hypothetical protein
MSMGARYPVASGYNQYEAGSGTEASGSPMVKNDFIPAIFVTTSYKFLESLLSV